MSEPRRRIRIFGEPELEGPDGPVKLRTDRQLGILLYGLLEGPRVRRDQLVSLFWPASPERRGRHSLTQALSELRSAVPGVVRTERSHVIVDGLESDLDVLSREPRVAERGELLEGIERLGGVELSQWLDAARERIRTMAARALERALRAAPDVEARSGVARAVMRLDPVNEHAVITLAERDLDAGRITDAVRRLRRHQERITAELGYDPQPRVAGLLRRLERGDAARAREAIVGESVRLDVSPGRLIGRDAEEAAMAEAWDDVCAGRPRSLRLSGAAGMGKSALMRNFMASLAGRGHLAFMITCHQATRAVPFAMLSDLIDALAADPGFIASDPTWLAEASRIHPALRKRFPGIPKPGEAPPESVRERLVEATTEILATIADGNPVALAFDDADQGDEASLSVVDLVRRRVRHHALLTLVATVESDSSEENHHITCNRHYHLGKLSDADIMTLLRAHAAARPERPHPREVLARVTDLADGNPLFALTLLHDHELHQLDHSATPSATEWLPPRDLMDAIARAAMRQSKLARRVLAVLATAGLPVKVRAVAKVAGVSEEDIHAAVVELLANERIRVAGDEMRLASPLWQAAIYHLESTSIRRYLHGCWAQVIASSKDLPDYKRLLATANQEALAGLPIEAAQHFREGARAAIATGAPGEARRSLEQALRLPVTHESGTWALLAEALALQGRYQEALEAIRRANQGPGASLEPERSRSRLLRLEVLHRLSLRPPKNIRRQLARLMSERSQEWPKTLELRALQLRAELAREVVDHDELGSVLSALDVAPRQTSAEVARATLTEGFIYWQQGLFRHALSTLGSAHGMLRDLHLPHEAARAANGAGISAYAAGRLDLAIQWFDLGLQTAESCEDQELAAGLIGNTAVAVEDSGFLDEALALNRISIGLAAKVGSPRREIHASLNLSDVLLLLGRIDDARDVHGSASRKAAETGDHAQSLQALLKLPDLAMAVGDRNGAVESVREIMARVENRSIDRFLRSRIVRQTCVASFVTNGMIEPLDPFHRRGTWTSFGRIESSIARAWLRMAAANDGSDLETRVSGPDFEGPLQWFRVTGVVLNDPWLLPEPPSQPPDARRAKRTADPGVAHQIGELISRSGMWV